MKQNLPDELTNELDPNMKVGETKRIQHLDGGCSRGKDACLSITRTTDGWWYNCFRCELAGFISCQRTPKETKTAIDRLRHTKGGFKAIPKITLPTDYCRMDQVCKAPALAYTWLYDGGLLKSDITEHDIGWSNQYQRVIIPVYKTCVFFPTKFVDKDLIGWIGRDVQDKGAKYLTNKQEDWDRIYFTCPSKNAIDKAVIIEDCLSAIKINRLTDYSTVALLTTYMPKQDFFNLPTNVVVWLDGNMAKRSKDYAMKMRSYGKNARHLVTDLDPKNVSDKEIIKKLK
jgi:hypothetical protein